MASIGGMDLPYGSQTQIVRTNVLAVAVSDASPDVGVTAAVARRTHNIFSQRLPDAIAPDFTVFFEAGAAGHSGYQASGYEALFAQDPDNDGVAESVSLEDHGVLRSLKEVPAQSGSARPSATFGTSGASYATGDATAALGADLTALGGGIDTATDNLEGSLAFQSILSVGAITLTSATDATQDELFAEGSSPADSPAALNLRSEFTTTSDLQSQVMDRSYEDFLTNYGGLSSTAAHTTGGGNVFALDLTGVVEDMALNAVADAAAVQTGSSSTEFNARADSDDLGDYLAAVASGGMAGAAAIISITSVCKSI